MQSLQVSRYNRHGLAAPTSHWYPDRRKRGNLSLLSLEGAWFGLAGSFIAKYERAFQVGLRLRNLKDWTHLGFRCALDRDLPIPKGAQRIHIFNLSRQGSIYSEDSVAEDRVVGVEGISCKWRRTNKCCNSSTPAIGNTFTQPAHS